MTTETTQEAARIAVTPDMLTEALTEFYLTVREGISYTRGQVVDPGPLGDALHATLSRIAAEREPVAAEGTSPVGADPMWQQAYMDVQKVLDQALGTEEEDGTGGGIASEVWLLAHQRDGARAERDRLRNGGRELGKSVVRLTRSMQAARIEMLQNGPEAAMQWILNSIPDVDDNDPGDRWDGTETATQWIDRVQAADRAAGAEAADEGVITTCEGCGRERGDLERTRTTADGFAWLCGECIGAPA